MDEPEETAPKLLANDEDLDNTKTHRSAEESSPEPMNETEETNMGSGFRGGLQQSTGQTTVLNFASGSQPSLTLNQSINDSTIVKAIHCSRVDVGTSRNNNESNSVHAKPEPQAFSKRKDKNNQSRWNPKKMKPNVERALDKLQNSVKTIQEIVCKFAGCEQLKDVKEIASLSAISFEEFIKSSEQTSDNKKDHVIKTGEEIHIDELHFFKEKKHRHVMVCASAGYGKTSILRHYAKKVANGCVNNLKHIRLVVYLQFRQLGAKEDMFLWQFITGSLCPFLTDCDKEQVLNWMVENPAEVIFILDGLDEYSGNLISERPDAGYFTKHKISDFVRSLLNKHLFPESTILTSSREHGITKLPEECHPCQIIMMNGFRKDAINRVICSLCGDDAHSILKHLEARGNFLYSICSIPFYLTMSIGIILKNPQSPPKTLTSLMVRALVNFMESNLIRSPSADVCKVTKLALYGMKYNKTVFDASDMEKVGVTQPEISDYVVAYSNEQNTIVKKKVEAENMVFMFPHKLLQEFYCSLEWLKFMGEHKVGYDRRHHDGLLQRQNWHYVKMFVFGTVFNDRNKTQLQSTSKLNFSIEEYTKQCLLQDLKKCIIEDLSAESLHLFFESWSVTKQLAPLVNKVWLHSCQSLYYDVTCLLRVLTLCDKLELLVFANASTVNDDHLKPIVEANRIATVNSLGVQLPNVSGELLGKLIGRCKPRVCHIRDIITEDCFYGLTAGMLREYDLLLLVEICFERCRISCHIGELMAKFKRVTKIGFENCRLKNDAFEIFCQYLSEQEQLPKLETLHFKNTVNPFEREFADLLSKRKIKKIEVVCEKLFCKEYVDSICYTKPAITKVIKKVKLENQVYEVEESVSDVSFTLSFAYKG